MSKTTKKTTKKTVTKKEAYDAVMASLKHDKHEIKKPTNKVAKSLVKVSNVIGNELAKAIDKKPAKKTSDKPAVVKPVKTDYAKTLRDKYKALSLEDMHIDDKQASACMFCLLELSHGNDMPNHIKGQQFYILAGNIAYSHNPSDELTHDGIKNNAVYTSWALVGVKQVLDTGKDSRGKSCNTTFAKRINSAVIASAINVYSKVYDTSVKDVKSKLLTFVQSQKSLQHLTPAIKVA